MLRFLKNNVIILTILNLGNVFAYLFQIVLGRVLTPDEYGLFNSLNSLMLVVSAPSVVVPLVFAKYAVQLEAMGISKVRSLLIEGTRWLTVIAVILFLFGMLTISWWKTYLHITEALPVIIMWLLLGVSLVYPVVMGIIQGLRRIVPMGIGFGSVPIVRFVVGTALVAGIGMGVNGALIACIVGALTAQIYGFWAARDLLRYPKEPLQPGLFRGMAVYFLPVLLANAMVTLLGNVDIMLVRHYCGSHESGLYATAAILGRISFLLPSVLISVLFPEVAKTREEGGEDGRLLWVVIGLTTLLGGGFAGLCVLFPEQVIMLLFGDKYAAAGVLLETVSVAMATLAVANVFFTYGSARSSFGFLVPLVLGTVLMLVLITLYHANSLEIARALLASICFILAGTLVWYRLVPRVSPSPSTS